MELKRFGNGGFGVWSFALSAATTLIIFGTSPAHAASVTAYPAAVKLEHQRDVQRIVMQSTGDDGVTLDLTRDCAAKFEPEGIATWGDDKRLHPVADGTTTLTLTTADGEVATVAVTVSNAALVKPASFCNDVEPVLMKAGCNVGTCHGSAQGKNGFRLTLFGYDPSVDYVYLTRDLRGRRMNAANPVESLMLTKPTGEVAHEGGTRLTKDQFLYNIAKEWIDQGATNDAGQAPTLTGIDVLPSYSVLKGEGAKQQLVVIANYSDGTDRDVTDLAVMNSSDEQTLKLEQGGMTTAGSRGEVYVMARFGTFAVVSQTIVLPADSKLDWPTVAVNNYIDEFVQAKLKKLRVVPAELCSDDIFLRRVYLDIAGVLPSVDETKAFLADTAPDKRAKLIEVLLQRPEFPELWAMKWADVLGVKSSIQLNRKGMFRYNDWLRERFTSNTPIDQIVRELLSAKGGNFTSPAANYYLVEANPNQIAENVAQVFFGIQIKCAQCHNHPFERWTMDDYYAFSAFFSQIGRKVSGDPREQIVFNSGGGEVTNIKNGQVMKPKFLGGPEPDCAGKDRREVLAEWLTSPENPWFAKNIANRIWQQFIGVGIIDPVDDGRVSNPPSNPQLLDALAKRLVESKYDLRQIVRDICNSYTYQQSTVPRDIKIADNRNFSHAVVRRLPAEQLLDAITQVTESTVKFASLPLGSRAVQVADGNSGVYFLDLFGRPTRNTACVCERRSEPTLGQTLHMINGDTINAALKDPAGRLAKMASASLPADTVTDQLYLAAFCRPPTEQERTTFQTFLTAATDPKQAMEDVAWSILNSKEFIFNH
jgi:hypothetical protein